MDRTDVADARAVLIGVSTFPKDPSLTALPSVEQNLMDLKSALTNPGILGLKTKNVTVLKNPSRVETVMETLQSAADAARGLLFVYYAGHGLLGGRRGLLHFAVRDSAQDKVGPWSALSAANVREAVVNSRAQFRVLIIDCCFSGRALDDPTMGSPQGQARGQVEIEGTVTLVSAPDNAPAMAPIGERNTAFTGEFLKVITSGLRDAPEALDLFTVFGEVNRSLLAQGRPAPDIAARGGADKRPVFSNAAYKPDSSDYAARASANDAQEDETTRLRGPSGSEQEHAPGGLDIGKAWSEFQQKIEERLKSNAKIAAARQEDVSVDIEAKGVSLIRVTITPRKVLSKDFFGKKYQRRISDMTALALSGSPGNRGKGRELTDSEVTALTKVGWKIRSVEREQKLREQMHSRNQLFGRSRRKEGSERKRPVERFWSSSTPANQRTAEAALLVRRTLAEVYGFSGPEQVTMSDRSPG